MHMRAALFFLAASYLTLVNATSLRDFSLCGFRNGPGGVNPENTCYSIEAECPIAKNSKHFCVTSVNTELGFLLGCAPVNQTQMCAPRSCQAGAWDEHGAKFIKRNICEAIDWSILVYESDDTIKEVLMKQGIHNITIGESKAGDVRFFHYNTPDRQWLVFRGTDPRYLCNVFADTEFALVPSGIEATLQLHHGFFAAAKTALKMLSLDKSKPLYVAGHSLGGAVASIAALILQNEGYEIDEVFTFGQPQVSDRKSIDASLNILERLPILRVIHRNDIAPYLFWLIPEEQRIINPYMQFGPELRIGINDADDSQYAYLPRATGTRKASADDHSACLYQAKLAAVAGCTPLVVCRP